jgi:predicted SnoaL-like aldol condensation-catalyzing enzyme
MKPFLAAAALAALIVAFTPLFAALPVTAPPASQQKEMLKSSDAKLALNKKLAYDFFRILLRGRRLDLADQFMHKDYMQHNPNAETGMAGFVAYFSALPGGPQPIPDTLDGLIAIQAEGDYVTLSFVREYDDPSAPGKKYTSTWFDMLRISDGKVAEHWDNATKGAAGPVAAAAQAGSKGAPKAAAKGK